MNTKNSGCVPFPVKLSQFTLIHGIPLPSDWPSNGTNYPSENSYLLHSFSWDPAEALSTHPPPSGFLLLSTINIRRDDKSQKTKSPYLGKLKKKSIFKRYNLQPVFHTEMIIKLSYLRNISLSYFCEHKYKNKTQKGLSHC